jgi:hypothetical protein
LALLVTTALAQGDRRLAARLRGYDEVPAISTVGNGRFTGRVTGGETFEYRLTYSDLQNVVAAHIHLAQRGVNGGVMAFLCGGGDKPACPTTGGTVTGTIDMDDIIGPAGQGIAPGEFGEFVAAMMAGVAYVNVHTNDGVDPPNTGPGDFPGGEIRGQIGGARGGSDSDIVIE